MKQTHSDNKFVKETQFDDFASIGDSSCRNNPITSFVRKA